MIEERSKAGQAASHPSSKPLEERLKEARARRRKVLAEKGASDRPRKPTKPWVDEGQPTGPEDDFDVAKYMANLVTRDPQTALIPEDQRKSRGPSKIFRVVAWGTAIVALAALGWTMTTGALPDLVRLVATR